jgi:8-oxo-dGTP pyrophosphatase MutT (NUDIX family)
MTSMSWTESYLGQLRALAGDRTLLFVGARGVMRDDAGRVLLIERSDNGYWSMPGGAMELGESVADCAIREVWEETGLRATTATPFAIYSGPQYTYTNMFGDRYQLFVVAFELTGWTGEIMPDPQEATAAGFFAPDDLPEPLSRSTNETLADLTRFIQTGQLVIK